MQPLEMLTHAAASAAKMERLFRHPWLADFVVNRALGPLTLDRDPGWARSLRTGMLKMGATIVPREAFAPLRSALRVTHELHTDAVRAHREQQPLVWVTWPVPSALFGALRVPFFCPENFYSIANASGTDGSTRMCEEADRHGIPQEICSINRCALGAHFAEQLPRPTLCVTANHPCDGNATGNTILRELARCDHFSMSGAYDRSPASVAVWARSVWELIAFLEQKLSRPMDWDLLRQYAENINRTNAALNRVTELHRALPAPGLVNAIVVYWRLVGTSGWHPAVVEGAELLRQGAEAIVARDRERKAPRERVRVLIGDQGISWSDCSAWLHREYGAAIVGDYIGSFRHPRLDTSSKERLIEGLVLDRLHFSMIRQAHGAMEYTLDELETTLREFSADCIIFNVNPGCKHNLALHYEIEELCRGAGVPACFLGVDIVDRRLMGEEAVRQKLRAFFAEQGFWR